MSLMTALDKLEPRERRLVTALSAVVGSFLFLLAPYLVFSSLRESRAENQEIRDLVQTIYEQQPQLSARKARQAALTARYARPAPALAGFIEEAAKANGLTAAESQDRPEVPHGKRYTERITVVRMHKVGMLSLSRMLEKIEQSNYPVAVTRLNIKPRANEPDSYEVELGVSAYDRKAEPAGAASAASAATAAPERQP